MKLPDWKAKRWLLAGACVAAALAAGVLVRAGPNPSEWPSATVEVRQLGMDVAAAGDLDTEGATSLSSAIKGDRAKILELIPEGREVAPGDVLVRFDASQIERDIARLQGEVSSREAVLNSSGQLYDMERAQADTSIRDAEFSHAEARQDYAKQDAYIQDLRKIGEADASIAIEIDQAQKRKEQLQAKLERADANIMKVKKESVYKVAVARANLDKVGAELLTTRTALREATEELRKTEIRAPSPGIVVHAEMFRDNVKRKSRIGDTAWQGQPLLYLPNTSSFIVRTRIRENDFHRIQIGGDALVKIDALPSVSLKGRVGSIGAIAARDAADPGSGEKYFDMVVKLTELHPRLRPGMTSRVVIRAHEVKALAIPIGAVFRDLQGPYCWKIPRNGAPVRTPVELGDRDEAFVEVRRGLSAGESVALVPPSHV